MSDNPQAFPWYIHTNGTTTDGRSGMTLRDYFAGQALVATATQEHDSGLSCVRPDRPKHPELAAKAAYRFADAMLAERSKP